MRRLWRSEWIQLALSLILVPVVLVLFFLYSTFFVKALGAPFLLLPSALGLIERASPADVIRVPTSPHAAVFYVEHPGRYVVYADDVFWRRDETHLDVRETALNPQHDWLRIQDVAAGEEVPVHRVRRGVRPYDEIVVKGRPMYTFYATHPGYYRAVYLYSPPAYVAVIPDHVSGKEGLLSLLIDLQVGALVAYPVWRRFRRWHQQREEKRRKREEAERVWEKIRQEMHKNSP